MPPLVGSKQEIDALGEYLDSMVNGASSSQKAVKNEEK
jgi:hypothetical protein